MNNDINEIYTSISNCKELNDEQKDSLLDLVNDFLYDNDMQQK